ncbi:MAG: hypothetical protein WCY09_08815 [Candidatus Omnitrophota bacterium]
MLIASKIIESGIFTVAVVGDEEIEIGHAMRLQGLELRNEAERNSNADLLRENLEDLLRDDANGGPKR